MTEITERLTTAIADRYRIEKHIGQGGMATVYLAEDLKHKRKVALKVLRPELAAVIGAERFLNEITVTANLQHPHILPLHDSGEADSFLFYVMPYVEGETLRDKLDREKQLAIDEAVDITKAVASALDYAHRQNVIHRDIKPENILLHDGQALVADFGIALAVSEAGGSRLTETGLSLGTPHYMSPEQAMGDRELDARSDIYSLGAMLYEMLAGEPPYTGSTAQAIVARVITEDPRPVTLQRRTVPQHVAASVHKALNKLPADRFHSAAEFAAALSNPSFTIATMATGAAGPQPARQWTRRSFANWHVAVALLLAAGLGGAAVRMAPGDPGSQPGPVARFTFGVRLGDVDFGSGVAISPDASQLVYIGRGGRSGSRLFRRALSGTDATPVAGTEGTLVMAPFLSADSKMLGFYADQQLRTVPVTGGTSRPLAPMSPTSGGGSWGPNNQIVYAPAFGSGLLLVSADGGDPRPLTTPDTALGVLDHRWPHILPDGKSVVFTIWRGALGLASIGVASIETGETRELIPGTDGRYLDNGYLVYAVPEGALRAVRFDMKTGEVRGSPVTVLDSVIVDPNGAAQYAVSRSGTLVYLGSRGSRVPFIVDEKGNVTPVSVEPGVYQAPRFSPDGRMVAVGYGDDIWIYDFDLGTFGPLTSGGGFYPIWSRDGRDIFFSRTEGADVNVYRVPADRGSEPVPIFRARGQQRTQDLSPDGKYLILRRNLVSPGSPAVAEQSSGGMVGGRLGMAGGQYDLWSLALDGDAEPEPWLTSDFLERSPTFSPDGGWIAYSSNESGRDEIYVRQFPGGGGRTQVSTEGGTEPAWAPDGGALYYRVGDELDVVSAETSPTFRVISRARVLIGGRYYAYPWQRQYDIHPDGRQFVLFRYTEEETDLTVVVNWTEGLKERLAGKR